MSRILLIGGYGGFGARIARRLAADGHEVLVAGRSLEKAQNFCAGDARLVPVRCERADIVQALAQHRPFAVVDAAGPFQGETYAVAQACIAARCHYLDIADARAFVTGIVQFDEDARRAGVVIVSGASSVPALSGAVVRSLAEGMEQIRAVEIAISASNRATAGVSVTRAIASYVGRPFLLWQSRRWLRVFGWHGMRREDFVVTGEPALMRRLVAFADVPDLDLLPRRLPGAPAVAFRAGTELAVQNIALRAIASLVRFGLLRGAEGLVPLMLRVQRFMRALGTDRSGMIVRLFGVAEGRRIERRWTLLASNGSGPEIPCLAVPLLLRRLREGAMAFGARDAGSQLLLADFEGEFTAMPVRHERRDHPQPAPLYRRVMGAAYGALPPHVRAMHDVLRDHGASGRAVVTRGRHPLARLVAALFAFPSEGEHALHVSFVERDGVETWTRDFAGRGFTSCLMQRGELCVERFGVLRFGFHLAGDETGLTMHLKRWWLGWLPLPLWLAPRSVAREWQSDGRFHFDVPIALPLIGLVVHYRGWLEAGQTVAAQD